MADQKVSNLPALEVSPAAGDTLKIIDDTTDKKITADDLMFGDATTPSTLAFGGSAATGSAIEASRVDHDHGMPAEPAAGAVAREGGQTTEGTSTSTSPVDLLTVGSLSIAAASPMLLMMNFRKTTGATASIGFGLKLNSTVISEANQASTRFGATSADSAAYDGFCHALIGGRVTNYPSPVNGLSSSASNPARTGASRGTSPATTAVMPIATITDIVVRSDSSSASVTHAADEFHIYSYATS